MKTKVSKRELINRLIILVLLFLSIFATILSYYLYNMLNFSTLNPPGSKPDDPWINIEPYVCFEEKSNRLLTNCNSNNCEITQVKNVIRLKGDTEGVQKFNQKLENLFEIYSNHSLKEKLNYSCTAIDKSLETSYQYLYEYLMLKERYIVLRIKVLINDVEDIDQIFYFDVISDQEIERSKLIFDLDEKYGVSIQNLENKHTDYIFNIYKSI